MVAAVAAVVLPFATALVLLPLITRGTLVPWAPRLLDLDVYQYFARELLRGGDILTGREPALDLPFTYPPFSALLFIPLALIPKTLLELGWILLNITALLLVLRRLGLTGWALALTATACVLVVEPVRGTLGFGQVNLLLLALVFLDLSRTHRRKTQGILTGLAAAIKLTPALFVGYLLFARQWRNALTAIAAAVTVTAITAAILPRESVGYVRMLIAGEIWPGATHYVTNQSVLGATTRAFGTTTLAQGVGMVLAVAMGLAGAYAAARWYRRGNVVLALSLCGVGSLLASPISWSHHFVWILPLTAALLDRELPKAMRWIGGAFVVWAAIAPFKWVLPRGSDIELRYAWWQLLVSDLGTMLGIAVVIAALGSSRVRNEPNLATTR